MAFNVQIDAYLMIVSKPTSLKLHEAWVLAPCTVRGWLKTYGSRAECVGDLRHFGLLTPKTTDAALGSDLDASDGSLTIRTVINAETLTAAGFIEKTSPAVN